MAHRSRILLKDHKDWKCPFCGVINKLGAHKNCGGKAKDRCGAQYVPVAGHAIAVLRDNDLPWTSSVIEEHKQKHFDNITAIKAGTLRLSEVENE